MYLIYLPHLVSPSSLSASSILSALNSHSIKSEVALDFWKPVEYPLCLALFIICNGDGTRGCSNKCKQNEVLLLDVGSSDEAVLVVLLVDVIGLINEIVFCFTISVWKIF